MPQSLITAQAKGVLHGILMRGFTAVRDAGGRMRHLQAVGAAISGTAPVHASRAITQTAATAPGPRSSAATGFICCGGRHAGQHRRRGQCAARCAELRNGAHQIKVMAGGGVAS
jgi:imidazolonepropionase-like amidohydrolase